MISTLQDRLQLEKMKQCSCKRDRVIYFCEVSACPSFKAYTHTIFTCTINFSACFVFFVSNLIIYYSLITYIKQLALLL